MIKSINLSKSTLEILFIGLPLSFFFKEFFINLYFPFVFDSINYLVSLVSNSLGYGFGLLAYFLLILFIIFIGNYLAGFISFFYVRYFGSVKKVKKRRLKKK